MQKLFNKSRQGQMFILATMLIAIYIVSMAAALMNIQVNQLEFNRESLSEPYFDSKREIQNFLEYILSKYTQNNSGMSQENAKLSIKDFLKNLEYLAITRGILAEFSFIEETFQMNAKQPPYTNVTNGNIYSSEVSANFKLKLTSLTTSLTIEEIFNLVFHARVEVFDNQIFIFSKRRESFQPTNPYSIFILNGTIPLIPNPYLNQTGVFYFDKLTSINNIGILNVTLPNGIRILS
ncbi:hypothetical protein [Candidatus Hodarchaeum mangrovi]